MSDSTQPQNPSMTPHDPSAESHAPDAHQQDNTQAHLDTPLDAPTDPSQAMAQALSETASLQAKLSELQDQYLRGQAEVLNARKRADEEVSKARKFAIESFAESLLPVLDSLEAGLLIKEATPEQIKEGAEATLRQLKSALERNKVIAIEPAAGTKFDPHHHQAISVVPAEQDPNTVVMVLQKGYLISERILRPALVTVTAA
ncbi:MAG: nucleotide exchange factor GrpE [Betaproteobacteria bacterium]